MLTQNQVKILKSIMGNNNKIHEALYKLQREPYLTDDRVREVANSYKVHNPKFNLNSKEFIKKCEEQEFIEKRIKF